MSKKTKLIFNIITTALYIAGLVTFFTDYVYVWILGIGKAGSYKGYEVALNFDGMPTNLGTLFPLLFILGCSVFGIITVIKDLAGLKKEEVKGKKHHPLLCAIFFGLFSLVSFFLLLSTFAMLNLPAPKRYGGYYLGISVYIAAYGTLIGGVLFFVTESGIFAPSNVPTEVEINLDKAPAKPVTKPAPVAPKASPAPQAKPVQPQAKPVQPQAARPVQPAARPVQPVKPAPIKPVPAPVRPAPTAAKPAPAKPTPAVKPVARPVAPQAKPVAKPIAKPAPQQVKK